MAQTAKQKRFSVHYWLLISTVVAAFIAFPLLVILYHLFYEPHIWTTLFTTLRTGYIFNTFYLAAGAIFLSLILGVPTAWAISNYRFPGSRFLEWGLILPLTIPTYILSITYAGIFDFSGPIQRFLRSTYGTETAQNWYIDIMTPNGLLVLLALSLYPYVYVAAKTAFGMRSASYTEAARSLGAGKIKTFTKVVLPLARPAIFGGLFLVVMEVFNDYGAARYFGVPTFTTEIFRSWFSREDGLSIAVKLSALLLVVIIFLIRAERTQRGLAQRSGGVRLRPVRRTEIKGWKGILTGAVCSLPVVFGFAIPVAQLGYWSGLTVQKIAGHELGVLILNSCLVALVTSVLVVSIAVLFAYTRRITSHQLGHFISQISVIGYAIPGAVIAVGVLLPFAFADRQLHQWFGGEGRAQLWLSGTFGCLVFAYIVRFMAVGFNGVEAGFEKVSTRLDEAGRSLGRKKGSLLLRIHFPLLKTTLAGALLLVFVDVLKELPLTLILRPFGFDTLATRTFELANDELIAQSAVPALVIVMVGIMPIFLLHKVINKQAWKG